MHTAMNTTEVFLLAMLIVFTVPYLIWRLGDTNYYAPLVVVQMLQAPSLRGTYRALLRQAVYGALAERC